MSGITTCLSTPHPTITAPLRQGKWFLVFLLGLFFSFPSAVVGQANTTPIYTWLKQQQLPTVNVSLTSVNTEDITIAVATDPDGNVYTLSFGKGIAKRNSEGVVINANFIPASKLDGPLDMAIDSGGFIYVANYLPEGNTFADNGQIRVFNPQGSLVRTILTSFYRPMGLVVDEEKVYVAEFYDGVKGPEPGNMYSRIRIYNKTTGDVLDTNNQVEVPLRIAIDSQKRVYVSQAGYTNNSKLQFFDADLNFITSIAGVTTPGSIVIDKYDYIHVVDYAGRIDFSRFMNFENLETTEVLDIAKSIYEGQQANAFSIKIFSPSRTLLTTLKNQIDLPLDLSINDCDRMYVNNSKIFGTLLFGYFLPSKIEFQLEIFKRAPSFDQEKPILTCPTSIEATAPAGQNSVIVNFANPIVTDNCSFTVTQTEGESSGSQFSVGTHTVEFTATDTAGNQDTCSFTITVKPAEEEPDTEAPVITCPQNITRNIDSGSCGAVVTYSTPTATDNSGSATVTLKEGIASGGTFPVGVTEVTYEAVDEAGNKKECSFTVTVKDNEKPTISCPADITVTAPTDSNSVEVNYSAPSVNDRCSTTTITQTGPASGSQFTVGEHTIEFTATDAAGNIAKCSLKITVNPAPPVGSPAVFENCNDLTANAALNECGANFNYPVPTASDNQGSVSVDRVSGPAPGDFFPVGTTTVVYEATGSDGITRECSFGVTIVDNQKPVFPFCPSDIIETAPAGQDFAIISYTPPNLTDNCSPPTTTRTGPASGEQFPLGSTTVTFTATDAAGNIETCSFKVTINPSEEEPDTEDPIINCPQNITRNIDSGTCGAVVTYPTPTATDDSGSATITFKSGIASGGIFPVGVTTVTYDAVDEAGNKNECSFTVTVKDNEEPNISCPEDITVTAPPGQNSAMVNYSLPTATDNCGTPTVRINQGFAPGAQFPLGSTAVIYTATDAAGNTATCSFIVTVEPGETEEGPANFNNCPATITHSVSTNTCGANVYFQPPTASDESGNVEVVRVGGPGPGDYFEMGSTVVTFEATGSDGNTIQCELTVIVVDNENPAFISCPSDISITAPVGQNSAEVNYTPPTARDNCGTPTVTHSGPASGSQFPVGTTTVTFTATDSSGGTATCSFIVTVEPNDVPLTITCPESQTRSKNENCEVAVPDFLEEVTANKDASISQNPPAGTVISESTTITITATAGNETEECSFLLTITDNSPPSLSCLEDQVENYDSAIGYTLPDYRDHINATDNCGIETIEQDPAPGTVIFEDQLVILYVWDTSNMLSNCSFTVSLTEEEVLEITCPGDLEANYDSNCSFVVPDFRDSAITNFTGAQMQQEPAPGTLITESQTITLTATLGEETDSCSFRLNLVDNETPALTCIPEQNISIDPEVGFTVPDYREEANPTDNCNFEWVQTPAPNTVIYASQAIEISATDAAGNRVWCSFIVRLTEEEPEELVITCPENQSASLDANCEFLIPDYTSLATVNIPGAVVTQNPPAGTTINSGTGIRLTATSGNQTVNCDFDLTLEDITAPTVVCPPDQWENYDPATDFALPDYRDLAVTSDACGIAQIQQSPSPGTNITQNTTVSLSVTDLSGNSITCVFTVNLTEDEVLELTCPEDQEVQPSGNCSFALPDYTIMADVNFEAAQVTQAPAPGTQITGNTTVILTATLDGQSDSCAFDVYFIDSTAPVANCIATGGYRLDQNGTLTLTPEQIDNGSSDNCGIVDMEISRSTFTTADIGDHTITLTVTDAAGNSDSCETFISILPYAGTGNEFSCRTSVIVELDETGNAVLNPQDLYTGDSQGRSFTLSKSVFSCSDVGENYINLTYQGNIDSGTCEIKVEVRDNMAPIVQTQDITVFLSDEGRVEISPALINNGSIDNCGGLNFTLDKSSFSCKDIGQNQVRLTAVDSNGNSASATAMVTVTGNCDVEPPPGGSGLDDLFIYPNPTPGPFTIVAPSGVKIVKVEIFDFRGRFLLSKDFADDSPSYTMDITGVEQAVYVLKIQTSDGRRIRRVIKY